MTNLPVGQVISHPHEELNLSRTKKFYSSVNKIVSSFKNNTFPVGQLFFVVVYAILKSLVSVDGKCQTSGLVLGK